MTLLDEGSGMKRDSEVLLMLAKSIAIASRWQRMVGSPITLNRQNALAGPVWVSCRQVNAVT
jgi:hypothetical protein